MRNILSRFYKFDSKTYWQWRYRTDLNSGSGSYGQPSSWKAQELNLFISTYSIKSMIELGCGDGNQLGLIHIDSYVGFDPSLEAIKRCALIHGEDESKSFFTVDPDGLINNNALTADICVSIEVILHLVEDHRFEKYMHDLFSFSRKYVAIFNTASDNNPSRMGRHNRFRDHQKFVDANFQMFKLIKFVPADESLGFAANTGWFFYERSSH